MLIFLRVGFLFLKKTRDLSETFKSLPLNRILIETDAPYFIMNH